MAKNADHHFLLPSNLTANFFCRLIFVWTAASAVTKLGDLDMQSIWQAAALVLSVIGYFQLRQTKRVSMIVMLIVSALYLQQFVGYVYQYGFLAPNEEKVYFPILHAFAIGVFVVIGLVMAAIWAKLLLQWRDRSVC
ncbi:MAG: hypothetical protein AB7S74_18450 [Hyphomicrobium sp.]